MALGEKQTGSKIGSAEKDLGGAQPQVRGEDPIGLDRDVFEAVSVRLRKGQILRSFRSTEAALIAGRCWSKVQHGRASWRPKALGQAAGKQQAEP